MTYNLNDSLIDPSDNESCFDFSNDKGIYSIPNFITFINGECSHSLSNEIESES